MRSFPLLCRSRSCVVLSVLSLLSLCVLAASQPAYAQGYPGGPTTMSPTVAER